MKTTIAIFAVLALAGCATAEAQRANGPSKVISSTTAPDLIRDCMISVSPSTISATPFKGGWMIASSYNPNIATWMEVTPSPKGSDVIVYGQRGFRIVAERCSPSA